MFCACCGVRTPSFHSWLFNHNKLSFSQAKLVAWHPEAWQNHNKLKIPYHELLVVNPPMPGPHSTECTSCSSLICLLSRMDHKLAKSAQSMPKMQNLYKQLL